MKREILYFYVGWLGGSDFWAGGVKEFCQLYDLCLYDAVDSKPTIQLELFPPLES
jgi:hypothetical protein